MAYVEKNYALSNKYLLLILTDYEQEKQWISICSGMNDIAAPICFKFSYVTDEERITISRLLERDKVNNIISESTKEKLSGLDQTVITNF